ncbi:MAG: hypothetical protein ACOCM3_00440 [Campylobacter hyointestinalis]|uniref:hypothetical protein n=1 Tax=Campylobacter sp. 9BO TaxID=3424759 RepID=UPI003B4C9526
MRNLTIFALFALFLTGCADKSPEPLVIYKEKAVPTRCNATIPHKPTYDGSFESAKEMRLYWDDVESILKQCLGANNGK